MRILTFLILALGFSIVSCDAQTNDANAALQTVSVEDLKAAVDGESSFILLDVRTDMETDKGMLAGAKNIDIYDAKFAEKVNKLPKDQTIYVMCHMGGRSMKASEKMVEMGFTDVRNVDGGFSQWVKKGYPVQQ